MNRSSVQLIVVLLMGLLAGCGSKDKGAGEKEGVKGQTASPTVSAELLPFKTGKGGNYEDRRYLVNKTNTSVSHTSRKGMIRLEQDQGFVIGNKLPPDLLVLKLYTQQSKGPNMECSGGFGDELFAIRRIGNDTHWLFKIYPEQAWTPFLKDGAKPGEKWEKTSGPFQLVSKVVGSSQGDSGIILEQTIYKFKATNPIGKYRWYFSDGQGIVRLDIYWTSPGEKDKTWVPFRQMLMDDWKGDRSPLVVEEITFTKTK